MRKDILDLVAHHYFMSQFFNGFMRRTVVFHPSCCSPLNHFYFAYILLGIEGSN